MQGANSIPPRPPDPRIETDGAGLPALEIADYLDETLGQPAAVFLKGQSCVEKAEGCAPRPTAVMVHHIEELRLRQAYKISRMIAETFDDKTARAWLFGKNLNLDDEAPISILRRATDPAEFAEVLAAARSLVGFGG